MKKNSRNNSYASGSNKKYKQHCLGNAIKMQNGPGQTARSSSHDLNATNSAVPSQLLMEAVALHQAGMLDEAKAAYQALLRKNSNDSDALHYLGLIALQKNHHADAVSLIEAAIRINRGVPAFHCNLGNAYRGLKQFDAAIAAYLEAVRLDPQFQAAHSNLGNTYKDQGKLDEAAASYRTALLLKPDFAEAHSNLGTVFYIQGKHEEAVASYQKALDLNPLLVTARIGMSTALSRLVPTWHVPMMNDTIRNNAYYEALKNAVTADSDVFEIGTGSGLLSMMSAKLGARKVTTCEATPIIAATAQRVISANGLDKRINVISSRSNDVAVGAGLDDKADILVSEIFSSELLAENVLSSIEDAKHRLLKQGARVIPAQGSIMVALFGGEDIRSNLIVEDSCGFNLRPFNSIVAKKQFVHRNDLHVNLLTDDVEAFHFDFQNDGFFPSQAKILRIPIKSAGRCYGIVQWIRLQMDKDTVFENHPSVKAPASSWQLCTYISPSPIDVKPGQVALISSMHNRINPWFSLEGFE